MEINKYQLETLRTQNKDLSQMEQIMNSVLGLIGESGEIVDLIKKHYFQYHILDKDKVKEEIGDLLWYISNLCNTLDIKLESILELNIKKLSKRYKKNFTVNESVNRVN